MFYRSCLTLGAAALLLTGCLERNPAGTACQTITPTPLTADTVTTQSGLRYLIAQQGQGEPITATQKATLDYLGYLPNGTLFDTSLGGGPVTFSLTDNLIEGFKEGVTGMRVNELRRLIVPPNLAYGNQANGPCIPPNSTLIFDVQLLGISD